MIRRNFLCIAALLLFNFGLFQLPAQDISPTGPEAGRDLAEELRSLRPTENAHWHGTLKISGRSQALSVPLDCQTVVTETNWSVTYLASATQTNGAEKLTVIFSTNAPNQYIYARATTPTAPLGKARTLSGADADIPLAGSDFWLSELGFEFFHWPGQMRLPGQMRRGRPCYVLESTHPPSPTTDYTRVLTWVEKESGQPMQAEAYGADGKLIKEFEIGSVEKVNGKYTLKDLKMINWKTHSRTILNIDTQDVSVTDK